MQPWPARRDYTFSEQFAQQVEQPACQVTLVVRTLPLCRLIFYHQFVSCREHVDACPGLQVPVPSDGHALVNSSKSSVIFPLYIRLVITSYTMTSSHGITPPLGLSSMGSPLMGDFPPQRSTRDMGREMDLEVGNAESGTRSETSITALVHRSA